MNGWSSGTIPYLTSQLSPVLSRRSPLHYAAANRNSQCVVSLVRAGAEVNDLDLTGSSPLHYAAASFNFSGWESSSFVVFPVDSCGLFFNDLMSFGAILSVPLKLLSAEGKQTLNTVRKRNKKPLCKSYFYCVYEHFFIIINILLIPIAII